ncbi:hypothetical protein [Deinococcus yavapaiensis]|uniref:Uncharacterized protein n=1 Tax=Deinococcus yavapaiensis KR-236 TaxID=694435 RepID=A0A318S4H8_9DEIO|nr:hypothetical protein [Deinococcus yavapaiensis]PYE52970.1 hypothetical protein DES52_111143 [Deinococcus yavapaiensis KR-236]
MLREYAVEPDALAQHPLPYSFVMAFGSHSGRYLATLQSSSKWRRRVAQAIHTMREQGRGSARALAQCEAWLEEQQNTASQTIYVDRTGSPYDGRLSWLENALKQHADDPFDAVLTEDGRRGTQRIDEAHDGQSWWRAVQSRRIAKKPEQYGDVFGRTLARSHSVLLLDPYFSPSSRHVGVLGELLGQLEVARGPSVEIVCLCTANNSADTFEVDCERRLPRLVPAGVTLKVRRVEGALPEKFDKFHDRFLLTDRLNVMVGYGFDSPFGAAPTTTLAMITPEDAMELRSWIDDSSRFATDVLWVHRRD